MSLGYAEKLSFREDLGGQLGAPELQDDEAEVEAKAEQLAELIRNAQRIVAFTGAGISTACGIPDFRGPNGIWTLQRAGQPLPRPKVSFSHAKPSFTHQVLVALMRSGKLTYLVSQNVDGLHLRSGIPRAALAELHGNCFAERCHSCGTEYVRDFEVETVGFKRTGRKCSQEGCGAALRDHILDWEDALPEDELALTEEHTREADLAICLGTSLQITPACNLPLKATRTYKGGAKQQPGKLVIINLQRTQHDNKAVKSGGLVCHARCDEVMRRLVRRLGLRVPPYIRRDAVVVGHQQHGGRTSVSSGLAELEIAGGGGAAGSGGSELGGGSEAAGDGSSEALTAGGGSEAAEGATEAAAEGSRGGGGGSSGSSSMALPFSVFVQSSHGPKCPMPMVLAVDVTFDDPALKPASLTAPPFTVRRTARRPGPVRVCLTLHLHQAADEDKRTVRLTYTADLQAGLGAKASLRQERHEFVTQCHHYDEAEAEAEADGCAAAADARQRGEQPAAVQAVAAAAAGGGAALGAAAAAAAAEAAVDEAAATGVKEEQQAEATIAAAVIATGAAASGQEAATSPTSRQPEVKKQRLE